MSNQEHWDEWLDEPIGPLIERVRERRGKSQYTLAEALRDVSGSPSVDRGYVTRWEHARRIPTPYWRRHLSTVLDIPLEVLDRAAALARADRVAAKLAPNQAAPGERFEAGVGDGLATAVAPMMAMVRSAEDTRTLREILDLWDDLMRRRTFLRHTGAAAAATLFAGAPTQRPAVPDVAETIETYAALTADYRRLDSILGPGAVYAQALEHHRQLLNWLRLARDHRQRTRIAALATDASILVAWLHFDLERYDQASELYRQTFDLALEFGDVDLRAFLVGRMSRTLSECGRYAAALAFAESADQIATTGAIPAVRSWLAVTRAYVHACLGDERSCRRDLDNAATALDHGDAQPPPYIAFYGLPYLRKWSGHALLKLGEQKVTAIAEGRSIIDQALQTWVAADVRESGEVLAACASARLAQREIDEAARLTGRAYDIAVGTGSPRVLRYVTDLRSRLSRYRHTPAVRSFDERLLTGR